MQEKNKLTTDIMQIANQFYISIIITLLILHFQ